MASPLPVVPFPLLPPFAFSDRVLEQTSTPRSSFYRAISISSPVSASTSIESFDCYSSFSSTDSGYYSTTMGSSTDGELSRQKSTSHSPKLSLKLSSKTAQFQPSIDDVKEEETRQSRPKGLLANTLQRVKNKKSLGTITPRTEESWFTFDLKPQARSTVDLHAIMSRNTKVYDEDEDSDDDSVYSPDDRNYFIERCGMKHHPYSREEAPYMQAYETTQLQNDYFTHMLLKRLSPGAAPSFIDHGKSPPRILDLGCGSGRWVIDAANFWKDSTVTGFDLVDTRELPQKVPKNARWVKGNFLLPLPFGSDSFDLVRMANLSLCIPSDKWSIVFTEVRRIMSPQGRLELIDDVLVFPYEDHLPFPLAKQRVQPPFCRSTSANEDIDDLPDHFREVSRSRRTAIYHKSPRQSPERTHDYDRAAEWEQLALNSQVLESVFMQMLRYQYDIDPRPQGVIEAALDQVFGRYHANKIKSFNIALAPAVDKSCDKVSVGSTESPSKKFSPRDFITLERKDRKDKQKGDKSPTESSSAIAQQPEPGSPVSVDSMTIAQSPGLFVWPATFIPMSPQEVEMHACKNVQMLLGCKAALSDYLQGFQNDIGESLISEKYLKDLFWDYESFRRKRFNWPSEIPETGFDEHDEDPQNSSPLRISGEAFFGRRPRGLSDADLTKRPPPYARKDLTFVRGIKVYEATKLDPDFDPS